LFTKYNISSIQNIYINYMQISCLEIFVRYLKILIEKIANISNIPKLIVIILVSCISNIKIEHSNKKLQFTLFYIERIVLFKRVSIV